MRIRIASAHPLWLPQTATLRSQHASGAASAGRHARGSPRLFTGAWGAHHPEFVQQPVPAGTHKVVLALSGAADGFSGWARALHKEAGAADDVVHVLSGRTARVEFRVTIGPPTTVERLVNGRGWSLSAARGAREPRA